MSEEIDINPSAEVSVEAPPDNEPSLEPGFRSVCLRLGLIMIIVFAARAAGSVIVGFISPYIEDLSAEMSTLLNLLFSCLFLYAIPMVSAAFILKHPLKNSPHRVYSKPKYFGRAMAMLPAGYGLAISVRLLTMLVSSLIPSDSQISDSFHAVEEAFIVPNMTCALITFFQLTVIAPILEEMLMRGMVMESLRPYGNGFAIFLSALLFGIMHANFEQFFYATALGIFLGYIAISTQSIVSTTIMHMIFNAVSGCFVLLSADEGVGDYLLASEKGEEGVVTAGVVLYIIWMVFVMIALAVGVIMLIYKLIKIKKYRVPKVQTELSAGRRWGIFFTSATVIVMLILALDTFTFNIIPNVIFLLLASPSRIPEYFRSLVGNKPV